MAKAYQSYLAFISSPGDSFQRQIAEEVVSYQQTAEPSLNCTCSMEVGTGRQAGGA